MDRSYPDRLIESILNTRSMKQVEQSFEDLTEALKKANPLIIEEPKSKYINNPIRNYRK